MVIFVDIFQRVSSSIRILICVPLCVFLQEENERQEKDRRDGDLFKYVLVYLVFLFISEQFYMFVCVHVTEIK